METPQVYSTAPIPSLVHSSTSASTTSVVKTKSTTIASTSRGSTIGSTTTSSATASTTDSFTYSQLAGHVGTATAVSIPEASIIAADYKAICPNGNCFTDCQNVTRLFQSVPDGINADQSLYGKVDTNGGYPDVTLFGVCSNLATVAELAQANSADPFASYFPTTSSAAALHNVTTDISMCLLETCQKTRDPSQCINECSLDMLQSSNTTLSIEGIYPCMFRLCNNTCGLPYANQDVFGVGVLASYITQAILVLILAVVIIVSASWRLFRQHDADQPSISKKLRESMETFLSAQCYFGISAAIASYFLDPSGIDPLNGYPLLSVAVTGFLPTAFTLMLLHNHGVKSWYTSILAVASWFFSTILFFMLIRNLSGAANNPRAIDRGLISLFEVESCGKSAAMSVCQQTFDDDPLAYLSSSYNWTDIPNIKTMPVLWVLSTVILFFLIGLQMYDTLMHRESSHFNASIRLGSLYIGSILFGLALGYQARMVIVYTKMDVIDWDGWTFGQVVALLFWVPALLDCIKSYARQSKEERKSKQGGHGYSKLIPDSAKSSPAPLAMPSPNPSLNRQRNASLEPLRASNTARPSSQIIEMTSFARKPVATPQVARQP